jgi:hypothetical protein
MFHVPFIALQLDELQQLGVELEHLMRSARRTRRAFGYDVGTRSDLDHIPAGTAAVTAAPAYSYHRGVPLRYM